MCLVFWGKPSLRRGAELSWHHAEVMLPLVSLCPALLSPVTGWGHAVLCPHWLHKLELNGKGQPRAMLLLFCGDCLLSRCVQGRHGEILHGILRLLRRGV